MSSAEDREIRSIGQSSRGGCSRGEKTGSEICQRRKQAKDIQVRRWKIHQPSHAVSWGILQHLVIKCFFAFFISITTKLPSKIETVFTAPRTLVCDIATFKEVITYLVLINWTDCFCCVNVQYLQLSVSVMGFLLAVYVERSTRGFPILCTL